MTQPVLRFGLMAGALLSAMMLLTLPFLDRIGFDKGMLIGYSTMVLAFLMVYFGVRSYRSSLPDGRLGFGRAFLVGLLITLVATACYVATWELFYFQLAPDFGDKYAAYAIDQLRRSGATAAQIEAQVQAMDAFRAAYRQPLINIAYTFLEPLPVGLVFTTVTAWLMSRPHRPAAEGGR